MADIKTEPKRLIDLNPQWIDTSIARGVMISYDCPCGEACGFTRVVLALKNPLEGEPLKNRKLWTRSGEDFATLTLSPSVHAVGHWHGWVRNGMVTSC